MVNRLKSSRRQVLLGFTVFLLIVAAVSCSSGDGDKEEPTAKAETSPSPTVAKVEPTATKAPIATAAPAATKAPTATAAPAPTKALSPTTAPAPTSTPEPTAAPDPTAIPVPLTNVYDIHGFTVELDQDATFADSNLNIDGWSGTTADASQGLMTFNYNGADVVLFWQPQADATPQETIEFTYQLQQLGNPDLLFASLSDGDITVDGTAGRFTGFLSTDSAGGNATGGLIGAWTCADSGTQLSMTATGSDSTALQIRFDRIISGFSCD